MRGIFHYYYFATFKVDVFGYDEETEQFAYSVETEYSSKIRSAKKQYKTPDKRNEWRFPFGTYIYIIDPNGKKHRLFLTD
jgi:hypothetical protein